MTVTDKLTIDEEPTGPYTSRVTNIEGYLLFEFTPDDPLLHEIVMENNMRIIAHDEILGLAGGGVNLPESAIKLSFRFEAGKMIVRADVDDYEMISTEVTDEDQAYEDRRDMA